MRRTIWKRHWQGGGLSLGICSSSRPCQSYPVETIISQNHQRDDSSETQMVTLTVNWWTDLSGTETEAPISLSLFRKWKTKRATFYLCPFSERDSAFCSLWHLHYMKFCLSLEIIQDSWILLYYIPIIILFMYEDVYSFNSTSKIASETILLKHYYNGREWRIYIIYLSKLKIHITK